MSCTFRSQSVEDRGAPLQSITEFLDRQPSLANERTKRSLRNAPMIGHDQASMRPLRMPEDDVASPLMIDLVSKTLEGADCLRTRDTGEATHTATSTTSSSIGGGIGSS